MKDGRIIRGRRVQPVDVVMARVLRPAKVARAVRAALVRRKIPMPPLTVYVIVNLVYDVLALRPALMSQVMLDEHLRSRVAFRKIDRVARFERACADVAAGFRVEEKRVSRRKARPKKRPKRERSKEAKAPRMLHPGRTDLAVIQMAWGLERKNPLKGAALQKALVLALLGKKSRVTMKPAELAALYDLVLDWREKGYEGEAMFVENLLRACAKVTRSGELGGLDAGTEPM